MKSKIKLAAIIIICIIQLTACGKSNSNEPNDDIDDQNSINNSTSMLDKIYTGELEENVTIRILENDTAIEQGYFKELIEAFNEAYKEYGIVAVDANMDQYSNLEDDGPYGYGPDVIYQANDSLMKYVEGKHIYPIPVDILDSKDNIAETAWDAYRTNIDGKVYTMGVPVNMQSSMLFYRKDMLPKDWETNWDNDENGIPDMVETWSGLYKFSKEIIEKGEGKYGYMRSLDDPYFSSGYLFSYGGYIFGENNTNPEDIGLAKGDAEIGAEVLLQLASIMNEEAIDDSITVNAYKKIAEGEYFATMTTPDVYTLFIKELTFEYERQGMTKEEAEKLAIENLVVTSLPTLPASGNLDETDGEQIQLKAMGGINGYAISAYTEAPNAALAFVNFATSYEMILRRNELLGVVPARSDVANEIGGTSEILYQSLNNGDIVVMPSIREMAQVWTPLGTFQQDLTKDAFRKGNKKFTSRTSLKEQLEIVGNQIYDAIHILAE